MIHASFISLIAAGLLGVLGCARTESGQRSYTPRVREITVTTVPLLVQEQAKVFPFLKSAFAKGGVLDGKEVYAFSPSTLVVVEGDTIHFTFINPEDDVHSFVLPDFAVSLPASQTTTATYVATHAGVFPFVCAIPAHLPMMSGQLIVLTPSAVSAPAATSPSGPLPTGTTR
jgi:plastocyanin